METAGSVILGIEQQAVSACLSISLSMPFQLGGPMGRAGHAVAGIKKSTVRYALPSLSPPMLSCGLPATIGNANAGTVRNATLVFPSSYLSIPI
ncbi:hypothetical protein DKT77_18990 [Meridianimarinicoccus roseus]|uniref:Uncharacterized protein n=1 Tax=Meridianimarinicoccus roseus TaxID=2072018 RepID=A0A2V2L7D1_9RHOB|nr:hypothetical protein DKT77_18990 [Meridianimarinicoccus roseus]